MDLPHGLTHSAVFTGYEDTLHRQPINIPEPHLWMITDSISSKTIKSAVKIVDRQAIRLATSGNPKYGYAHTGLLGMLEMECADKKVRSVINMLYDLNGQPYWWYLNMEDGYRWIYEPHAIIDGIMTTQFMLMLTDDIRFDVYNH